MIFYSLIVTNNNNTHFKDAMNLIIPLIGAWVGAIIAFYFQSENLQKAQETIDKLLVRRLRSTTIKELLAKYPSARDVKSTDVDDNTTIGDIKNELNEPKLKGGPLVIRKRKDGKVFGLLYHQHLTSLYHKHKNLQSNDKFLDKIGGVQDFLTGRKWDREHGIENYAKLSLDDSLEIAKNKLRSISGSAEVRGLVFDGDNLKAIVDHEMVYESVLDI